MYVFELKNDRWGKLLIPPNRHFFFYFGRIIGVIDRRWYTTIVALKSISKVRHDSMVPIYDIKSRFAAFINFFFWGGGGREEYGGVGKLPGSYRLYHVYMFRIQVWDHYVHWKQVWRRNRCPGLHYLVWRKRSIKGNWVGEQRTQWFWERTVSVNKVNRCSVLVLSKFWKD